MRTQWRAFVAGASPAVYRILLHGMLFGLSFSISDMLFNFYLQSLGYDNLVSGQLQSSFRIAGVVLGIPIGMIIDRISAQRMLYIGILTYAIGWSVLLMVHGVTIATPFGVISPLQLMNMLYFIIGAANMATYTAVVPLLSTVIEPQQRASMFGINAAASTMVGFVGSIVAGMLPGMIATALGVSATSESAYRTALFGVCGFGLLAVVPLLGIQKTRHRMSKSPMVPQDMVPDGALIPLYKLFMFATPSIFWNCWWDVCAVSKFIFSPAIRRQ
jgi:MFS family permease